MSNAFNHSRVTTIGDIMAGSGGLFIGLDCFIVILMNSFSPEVFA
jgi:hypothetical protein